ncbi:MAG: Mrp/NBP35 family ATP-binding protein [Flavobacteriales bacterium]|nr:Mrp/NBP35 family ATP-binding protein [Flavobacteriales bacterium]
MTPESILKALAFVTEPELKKDIVTLGLVSNVKVEGNTVSFLVRSSNPALHYRKRLEEACIHQVRRFHGDDVAILAEVEALPKSADRPVEQRKVLPNVKKIIAIASGKGGVGKSTVTANLAAGLAKRGYKVGLVDADIYGPSMPIMFDVFDEKPSLAGDEEKNKIVPVENYGVKILSIGFFAEANQAIVWRGPMASKALSQMFTDVHWGELDFMLIDLPPGTGDIHLQLVQQIPLDGVVIVSTPQAVALADARKGVGMFQLDNIKIPVLGIVENMSWFTPAELPENKYFIFGKEGAKLLAEELNVPLLGQVPLVQSIREAGDVGRPAILQTDTLQAAAFDGVIDNVLKSLDNA